MLRSLPQLPTVPQNVEETSRLPLKIVHIDHAPSPWSLLEYLHYYIEDRADTDYPPSYKSSARPLVVMDYGRKGEWDDE
jgi:hypothetical protein